MTTCPRCRTDIIERPLPRKLKGRQDYELVKAAGFRLIANAEGTKAMGVWVPRFDCECMWQVRMKAVHEDLLYLVDHPLARREERRRAGLERYLTSPKVAA